MAEAAKIREIINDRIIGGYAIIGGFAVSVEIGNNRNDLKRMASKSLYDEIIIDEVKNSVRIIARAAELESMGLGPMDARHLAAAEAAQADYLLTTDLYFIKKCSRPNFTTVNVINPLNF